MTIDGVSTIFDGTLRAARLLPLAFTLSVLWQLGQNGHTIVPNVILPKPAISVNIAKPTKQQSQPSKGNLRWRRPTEPIWPRP